MREPFTGLPASPGIGIGAPHVYRLAQFSQPSGSVSAPAEVETATTAELESCADQEWQHFQRAHTRADAELEQLIGASNPLVADIFSSQRLILHDRTLLESIRTAIFEHGTDAITATQQFIAEMEAIFRSMEDEYFANRSADILDVGQKIVAQLHAEEGGDEAALGVAGFEEMAQNTILFATMLTPSQLFALPHERISALALVEGTPTAHVAILARSLEIPLVCALDASILDSATAAETAIVDGTTGQIVLQPTAADLEHYTNSRIYQAEQKAAAMRDADQLALTLDGHCIPVCGNANGMHEVVQAFKHGADSIGLLRTEFLYLENTTQPDVEEQQQTLLQVADLCWRYMDERLNGPDTSLASLEIDTLELDTLEMEHSPDEPPKVSSPPTGRSEHVLVPGTPESIEPEFSHMHRRSVPVIPHQQYAMESPSPPLTVRLLDVGGDKPPAFIHTAVQESNPFLGMRGLRLLLHYPELLRTQLRAIVRTAMESPVRIRLMVPMVTNLNELRTVRTMLNEVIASECGSDQSGLEQPSAEGVGATDVDIQIGVLVEVPGLALMVEHIAQEVDFLSIGTNDLTQYTMAADRANSSVATLADPLHPALLQLIYQVCWAGHNAGISVSVCGELASDPTAAPLLIGLGVTELSANPSAIPLVKQAVRRCDLLRCRQLAEQALHCDSSEAVRKLLTTQVMEELTPPVPTSPSASFESSNPTEAQ